jgi:hypothetical protein
VTCWLSGVLGFNALFITKSGGYKQLHDDVQNILKKKDLWLTRENYWWQIHLRVLENKISFSADFGLGVLYLLLLWRCFLNLSRILSNMTLCFIQDVNGFNFYNSFLPRFNDFCCCSFFSFSFLFILLFSMFRMRLEILSD